MISFLIRRLAGTIPVLLLIILALFLLLHAAPGDPAEMLLSDEATPQDLAQARARWGLDQPLWLQYVKFAGAALHGDLGDSFKYQEPVAGLIATRLPATLELALCAILIAVLAGVPLGMWAGARPNSWVDNLGSTVGFFGISLPSFWMGIMLILLVSGTLNLLPSAGRATYGLGGAGGFYLFASLLHGDWRAAADALSHLAMPAVTLGTNMIGIVLRVTRSAVIEIEGEDYIQTARAKGLGEPAILWRHVLKNAAIIIITVVGLELGTLLSGSIIVETVFAWPGTGSLLIAALTARDYPLIIGLVLAYTSLFVLINVLIDFCYAAIDPRIRFA
jgi:ABC-type dipeptide/oligopeptide/nickel transport system permease component